MTWCKEMTFRVRSRAIHVHDRKRAIDHRSHAQHGAFSLAQLGSPRTDNSRRARTGRWEYLRPGVYAIVGSPDTWERRLWVALLGAGGGAAVGRRPRRVSTVFQDSAATTSTSSNPSARCHERNLVPLAELRCSRPRT